MFLDIPHFHDWFLEVSVKWNMPYISINLLVAYMQTHELGNRISKVSGMMQLPLKTTQGSNWESQNPLKNTTGWPWFQICFIFTAKFRDMIQFDEQYVSNGLKPPTRQENGVLTMLPGSLWSLTAVDRIRCSVPKNCRVVACFCLILFPLELVHMENSKTMLTYRYDLMYICRIYG